MTNLENSMIGEDHTVLFKIYGAGQTEFVYPNGLTMTFCIKTADLAEMNFDNVTLWTDF